MNGKMLLTLFTVSEMQENYNNRLKCVICKFRTETDPNVDMPKVIRNLINTYNESVLGTLQKAVHEYNSVYDNEHSSLDRDLVNEGLKLVVSYLGGEYYVALEIEKDANTMDRTLRVHLNKVFQLKTECSQIINRQIASEQNLKQSQLLMIISAHIFVLWLSLLIAAAIFTCYNHFFFIILLDRDPYSSSPITTQKLMKATSEKNLAKSLQKMSENDDPLSYVNPEVEIELAYEEVEHVQRIMTDKSSSSERSISTTQQEKKQELKNNPRSPGKDVDILGEGLDKNNSEEIARKLNAHKETQE